MTIARGPETASIANRDITWPEGHHPASSRVFAQNIIEIAAAPETVWPLLIDCEAWPRWYKHCSDVSILRGGPLLGPGSQFRFKTLGFYFEPEITCFEPPRKLVWSATGPLGTSGAHAWLIEPTAQGCRVVTEEAQRGALLFFLGSRTRRTLLSCHADWLSALKALAENDRPTHLERRPGHHPSLPGAPLNGPATASVIHPP